MRLESTHCAENIITCEYSHEYLEKVIICIFNDIIDDFVLFDNDFMFAQDIRDKIVGKHIHKAIEELQKMSANSVRSSFLTLTIINMITKTKELYDEKCKKR